MDASVLQNGDLRVVPLARVVAVIARLGLTGVLELTEPVGTSRAFFLRGTPQGARLARLQNPLGQMLLQAGAVTKDVLEEALAIHNRTDKLLGQVLLEIGAIDEQRLQQFIAYQSQQNLFALFTVADARYAFNEGLVHLSDFTPCPTPALLALYQGLRHHAPERLLAPFLSRLPFVAVRLVPSPMVQQVALGPAEQMALRLLSQPRLSGDLARRVPLSPRALGALLLALDELGALELIPALKAV